MGWVFLGGFFNANPGPNLVWSNDKTMSLTSIGKLCVWVQVVFGPNLVWSNDKTMSLTSIGKLYVWVQVVLVPTWSGPMTRQCLSPP